MKLFPEVFIPPWPMGGRDGTWSVLRTSWRAGFKKLSSPKEWMDLIKKSGCFLAKGNLIE